MCLIDKLVFRLCVLFMLCQNVCNAGSLFPIWIIDILGRIHVLREIIKQQRPDCDILIGGFLVKLQNIFSSVLSSVGGYTDIFFVVCLWIISGACSDYEQLINKAMEVFVTDAQITKLAIN